MKNHLTSELTGSGKIIFLIACILIVSQPIFSQNLRNVPTFDEYEVSEKFNSVPAPAILRDRKARMYQTKITAGAKRGVNFAGHFTVVGWGTGIGAFSFVIINAKSGRTYFPPFDYVDASFYGIPELDEENPQFRIDSKLLILYGKKNGASPLGIYYYVFKKGNFRLISFVKAKTGREIGELPQNN